MSEAKASTNPTILVVPLDWGLGHATRCIPIIKALLSQQCTVLLAGEGRTKSLLQNEFPQLAFLPLEGYRVRYSQKKWALALVMAAQIPRILAAIKNEHAWLQTVVEQYAIDAVVSDNRFGLYHSKLPCVFVTHQLSIKTDLGALADRWLRQLNYRFINRFSECWVPDAPAENNLAGGLSHPAQLPARPVKYLGSLSRFAQAGGSGAKHILVLLSGPEPQRSILERLLLAQVHNHPDAIVFVRGLPDSHETLQAPAHVVWYNHLPAQALEQQIREASLVISRCGYSTVMDLAALQKKSILIPTPGQTEQEYLAKHLMKNNLALCIEQHKFNLRQALDLASAFDYHPQNFKATSNLQQIVGNFTEQLRAPKNKAGKNPAPPKK